MTQLQFQGNWSFSWLMKYESCPMLLRLGKIDKLPQKPLEPGNPLERGNRVHKNLDDYVQGKIDTITPEPRQIDLFRPYIEHLRTLREAGMATTEEDWLFGSDWETTGKKYSCSTHGSDTDPECDECSTKTWLWAKLDASVYDPSQNLAIAVDYKTGKSQYKAVEHIQQLQLYAAITALKFPDADRISAELWYLDESDGKDMPHFRVSQYTREEALRFIGRFDARAKKMYSDRFFRPNPNVNTCRYCPYGPRNGTGACPVGV